MEAERALRYDQRAICVCTSTLEVGIDIGDIDMVILAYRPRSVAPIAQRIGRGNRREGKISTIAVALTPGESSYYQKVFQAIVRSKYSSEAHPFDPSVAVQQTLAMLSGPESVTMQEIEAIFHGLVPTEEISSILEHLESGGWIDRREDGRVLASSRAREQGSKLYSNIPGSESIAVVERETGMAIGNITLPIDNIFILGGQAWMVRKRSAERVLVSKVESGTEIANFASYDRFGSFFDLLPMDLKMRYKKMMGKEQEIHSSNLGESASGAARWASS
jgi:ATP-dependent Lhr-like helicase